MLVPKLRFKRDDRTSYLEWNNQKLSAVSSRVTRKNKGNITDIPLTIASLYGLVDQREYFKKTIASQNMEGYYLLLNGEFAYNKSYSKGFDFGAIKRLDRYDCGALSTLYICFAVNNKVNSDFMTHYFDSQKWNKEVSIRCAEGARNHGLLNISTDDFFDIDMTLPTDLEEQRKIAAFLSDVDGVIAQSEAEVQNLERQKKAAMQKIFSQEIRFRHDNGTEYPEWKERELAYCFEERDTKQVPTEEAPLMAFIAYKGVADKGDRYDRSYLVKTDDKKYKRTEYDDFIYSSNNLDVGSIGLNKYGTAVISVVYEIFKVKDTAIPDFISALVQMPENMNKIIQYRQGCLYGQYKIFAKDFLSVKTAIPCIEEQQKIADFLSAYDEAIYYAKQELEKWKELKKGLLQQMFV